MPLSFFRRSAPAHVPASQGRTCATTVLNDAFVGYFLVFLYSILKYNPQWDTDILIQHSPRLSMLSEKNRERIMRTGAKVQFASVDEAPYERFFPCTPERLHAALLKLNTFSLRGYDRVVFLDSDMLCLGDISPLLTLDVPFAAAPAGKDRALKERAANTFRRRIGFNSGVMVIGQEHLDGRTYRTLLRSRLAPCPTADQDILMRFFRFRKIFCLDHRYNYHAQFFWDGTEPDVRILHYAGQKPLEEPAAPRMKVWFDHQAEMQTKGW